MGIGASMAGGNPREGRQDEDWYPTPPDVTQALFTAWHPRSGIVWEPACGDGAMARQIEAEELQVVATDLVDRGYGQGRRDFLMEPCRLADCIITNPPFDLAQSFVEKAFSLGVTEIALTLKSTWWHAAKRQELWRRHRPAMILPLTWRPDFLGKGGPTMEIMWCVWTSCEGEPIYRPLKRPVPQLKLI